MQSYTGMSFYSIAETVRTPQIDVSHNAALGSRLGRCRQRQRESTGELRVDGRSGRPQWLQRPDRPVRQHLGRMQVRFGFADAYALRPRGGVLLPSLHFTTRVHTCVRCAGHGGERGVHAPLSVRPRPGTVQWPGRVNVNSGQATVIFTRRMADSSSKLATCSMG